MSSRPYYTKPYNCTRFEWVRHNVVEPVLDAGCGDSAYFQDTDVEFTGMDIVPESEDMKRGRPDNFVEGDVQNMPFDTDEFRTVILAEVLEHVDNPVQAIQEAARVASVRVLITVPDESRWMPEAKPGEHEDHKRVYSGRMLFDQCIKAGLDDEQVKIDHLNEMPFCFWLATIVV